MLAHPAAADPVEEFLLLSGSSGVADEVLVRRAVRTAAVYKLHCALRRSSCEAPPTAATLAQVARELVRGHARAARVAAAAHVR